MRYFGEICALATALCWTGSSVAFALASRAAGALPANQFRLLAAIPLLVLLSLLLTGRAWPVYAGDQRVALLAASGIVGLVLGDIGLFHALATIGPRLSSVFLACWPAVTVALEACCGRLPGPGVLGGIALSTLGVAMVLLRHREGTAWRPGLSRRQWLSGCAGALLGAVGQAGGFVLAGPGMAPGADLPDGVDPLQATVVRMAAAALGLQLVATLQRQPLALRAVLHHRQALRAALLGACFGPVGGVWLSMLARRHAADAGVAAALMATTPVFMMPVAAVAYGARVGLLGVAGTLCAVAGAAICLAARA